MGVSKNNGTPKSSILIGVYHYFHHPFWDTPIFGKSHIPVHHWMTWLTFDLQNPVDFTGEDRPPNLCEVSAWTKALFWPTFAQFFVAIQRYKFHQFVKHQSLTPWRFESNPTASKVIRFALVCPTPEEHLRVLEVL